MKPEAPDKVLVVDDESRIRVILSRLLKDEGFEVEVADSGEKAIEVSRSFKPDVVLMDQKMSGIDGIEAMSSVLKGFPDTKVIIMTAYGSIGNAVEAIKKGAYDYITKPFDNEDLIINVKRALEVKHLSRKVEILEDQLGEMYSFEGIVAVSGAMDSVLKVASRAAEKDVMVFVQGESGTGKELLVRAIHRYSSRKNGPFVPVNCAAVPSSLIEDYFFGHEKGAFTDAKGQRVGAFERAQAGTLFLDEICEFPPGAQVKLLRAIQEKEIMRVGGQRTIPVDVRIITATNRDTEEEICKGNLREDLYYRLNVVSIRVPPLRERPEDIPPLVDHFIAKFNRELGTRIRKVSGEMLEAFRLYKWPGNVRELENVIKGAMVIADGDELGIGHLPSSVLGANGTESAEGFTSLCETVAGVERQAIIDVLRLEGGNRSRAAQRLGITRKTLAAKMKTYGLDSGQY